uniref:Uncharacterized protein n=1 Tax=Arundo donax TaxID=35708 RepID=A0A0A9G6H1_ARUDO
MLMIRNIPFFLGICRKRRFLQFFGLSFASSSFSLAIEGSFGLREFFLNPVFFL